ncbi:MAG: hypothetical protein JNK48_27610, partial [Bryobacterales bacterium]|nr:hypothetical protein [Bryobacterales bacterium]
VVQALPGSVAEGIDGSLGEVLGAVKKHAPEVVFNLCEAPFGRPDREPHVAAVLEWIGVPFTGSGSETLALCRRKSRTKAVLAAHGIAVPRSNGFPCVVKPEAEDGSYGIHCDSLCFSEDEVERARRHFAGPHLVEEFLPGREFAVTLFGREEPEYGAAGETVFLEGMKLFTYAAKWDVGNPEFLNTPMKYELSDDSGLRREVMAAARGAWRAVEARGYLRVDVRQDVDGVPRVLDVNPNPALAPGDGAGLAAEEMGWTWDELIGRLVEWAC